MVLTGVNSARDMVFAPAGQRPTYVGHDLRTLHTESATAAIAPQPAWHTDVVGDRIVVSAGGPDDGDGLSVVRAAAVAVWQAGPAAPQLAAGDDTARAALQRWALL